MISHLLAKIRPDFKVMTHSALHRAPEVRPFLLPIDFAGTPAATETNLRSRASALELLRGGGALVVFPSGMVSTAERPFARRAVDADWKPFTARAIMQTRATVVPVFFEGQNSRLFQLASHVGQTLRESLLFHEVRNKIGATVVVHVGHPCRFEELAHIDDRRELILHLRHLTHELAPVEPPPHGWKRLVRRKHRPASAGARLSYPIAATHDAGPAPADQLDLATSVAFQRSPSRRRPPPPR